uniref:Uncharacterized protein n=1 Tax=Physcomitrium patens TaxID=3218 RepID=A0A2K1IZS3_PHYPA|nr:hypothetical protein PHYPA_022664 [Physcomitrium patens]
MDERTYQLSSKRIKTKGSGPPWIPSRFCFFFLCFVGTPTSVERLLARGPVNSCQLVSFLSMHTFGGVVVGGQAVDVEVILSGYVVHSGDIITTWIVFYLLFCFGLPSIPSSTALNLRWYCCWELILLSWKPPKFFIPSVIVTTATLAAWRSTSLGFARCLMHGVATGWWRYY